MTVHAGEYKLSPNLLVFKSEGRSEDGKGRCSGEFQVNNMAVTRSSQMRANIRGRLHRFKSTRPQQRSRPFLR